MTSGTGLLEVGLPIATEFSPHTEQTAADDAPAWTPWEPAEQAVDDEADDAAALLGPQNARKRYDDDEEGDADEAEVDFDEDGDEEDSALGADDDDDDFDDDDDDDDFDDDDDDDVDDFDDE